MTEMTCLNIHTNEAAEVVSWDRGTGWVQVRDDEGMLHWASESDLWIEYVI